jgi:hypothetical protein
MIMSYDPKEVEELKEFQEKIFKRFYEATGVTPEEFKTLTTPELEKRMGFDRANAPIREYPGGPLLPSANATKAYEMMKLKESQKKLEKLLSSS